MRHHLRLRVLLPALASFVAACGGSTDSVGDKPGTSSGSTTSSSGGASSSSGSSGSSGTSGATSSSSSSGSPQVFETTACTSASTGYEPMVGVTVSAVDSLELRDVIDAQTEDPPKFTSRGISGTPCATAADKAKCTTDLASFKATGWQVAYSGGGLIQSQHRYGVTTKGDTLTAINEPTGLAAAIAPIDNAKDAALLITAKGDNYFDCSSPNVTKTATGYDVKVYSGDTCGAGTKLFERIYAVTSDGTTTLKSETLFKEGDPNCVAGRRPEGLAAHRSGACADAVGRFFAEAAHLEAASVFAFERLAGELLDLGAPDELVEAALASREDEVRHTRMTRKMAKRFGGQPAEPRVEELPARSKLAIALENATEGCVRETWGALVACRQAQDAKDDTIRCMMQVIAEDETKHAGLAWDVAAWLEPQLTVDERVIVEDARRRALADLRRELSADVHPDLRTRAGMPSAATALALLEALDQRFIAVA